MNAQFNRLEAINETSIAVNKTFFIRHSITMCIIAHVSILYRKPKGQSSAKMRVQLIQNSCHPFISRQHVYLHPTAHGSELPSLVYGLLLDHPLAWHYATHPEATAVYACLPVLYLLLPTDYAFVVLNYQQICSMQT